jgi:hypothetical protein
MQSLASSAKVVASFGCIGEEFADLERYGSYLPQSRYDGLAKVWDDLFKTERKQHRVLHDIAAEMWKRKSTGDIIFMVSTRRLIPYLVFFSSTHGERNIDNLEAQFLITDSAYIANGATMGFQIKLNLLPHLKLVSYCVMY